MERRLLQVAVHRVHGEYPAKLVNPLERRLCP